MYFNQSGFDIRFEWGLDGVNLLAPVCRSIIIIDVISFSTCVDIALSKGAVIYPFRWRDERLTDYAQHLGAISAVGSRTDPHSFSLAPSSMLRLPAGTRLVLPSPNGATLSLATGSTPTFSGCLRNAGAVAQAAAQLGPPVGIIAAGERWPDGSLRPGIEDMIGSGAVIHNLPGKRSPEAVSAEVVFLHYQNELTSTLLTCSSGKEAYSRGSLHDIELASQLNVSTVIPRLVDGAYIDHQSI